MKEFIRLNSKNEDIIKIDDIDWLYKYGDSMITMNSDRAFNYSSKEKRDGDYEAIWAQLKLRQSLYGQEVD